MALVSSKSRSHHFQLIGDDLRSTSYLTLINLYIAHGLFACSHPSSREPAGQSLNHSSRFLNSPISSVTLAAAFSSSVFLLLCALAKFFPTYNMATLRQCIPICLRVCACVHVVCVWRCRMSVCEYACLYLPVCARQSVTPIALCWQPLKLEMQNLMNIVRITGQLSYSISIHHFREHL